MQSDWHIGSTVQMLAVTKQIEKLTYPCYSNPENKATDVAFEEVSLTDAKESETSVSHFS